MDTGGLLVSSPERPQILTDSDGCHADPLLLAAQYLPTTPSFLPGRAIHANVHADNAKIDLAAAALISSRRRGTTQSRICCQERCSLSIYWQAALLQKLSAILEAVAVVSLLKKL